MYDPDELSQFLKPNPVTFVRRQLVEAERVPLAECDASERPRVDRGDPPEPVVDVEFERFVKELSLGSGAVMARVINCLREFGVKIAAGSWSIVAVYPDGHKAAWRVYPRSGQVMSGGWVGYSDGFRSTLGAVTAKGTVERARQDALAFLGSVAMEYRRHRVGDAFEQVSLNRRTMSNPYQSPNVTISRAAIPRPFGAWRWLAAHDPRAAPWS